MQAEFSRGYSKEQFKPKPDDEKVNHDELVAFAKYVLLHGFFLNYAATILFEMPLMPWTIPAYGLAWWYLREEVPKFIYEVSARRGL